MSDKPKTILVKDLKPGMKCLRESDDKPVTVEVIKSWGRGQYWITWKELRHGSGVYFGNDEVVLAK